jgi:hypothetical protein
VKIIEELIQELTSGTANIETALLKAQVLAHQLGDMDMKKWVDRELRGYENDVDVPQYRVTNVILIGDISDGYWRHPDRVLPTFHLDEKIRRKLTVREIRDSISVVNEMANPERKFFITVQPEYFHLLAQNFTNGYEIEQARGSYPAGSMTQVITQVRARLLDFVLELSSRMPGKSSPSEIKDAAERKEVNKLFNNTIFGNNTTIIIGNNNSQDIKIEVVQNDIQSLHDFLRRNHVPQEDIAELDAAISADSQVTEAKNLPGAQVKNWIGKMVSKAGTASWQVTAEAAGNLLSAAIAAFYGLTS